RIRSMMMSRRRLSYARASWTSSGPTPRMRMTAKSPVRACGPEKNHCDHPQSRGCALRLTISARASSSVATRMTSACSSFATASSLAHASVPLSMQGSAVVAASHERLAIATALTYQRRVIERTLADARRRRGAPDLDAERLALWAYNDRVLAVGRASGG